MPPHTTSTLSSPSRPIYKDTRPKFQQQRPQDTPCHVHPHVSSREASYRLLAVFETYGTRSFSDKVSSAILHKALFLKYHSGQPFRWKKCAAIMVRRYSLRFTINKRHRSCQQSWPSRRRLICAHEPDVFARSGCQDKILDEVLQILRRGLLHLGEVCAGTNKLTVSPRTRNLNAAQKHVQLGPQCHVC